MAHSDETGSYALLLYWKEKDRRTEGTTQDTLMQTQKLTQTPP